MKKNLDYYGLFKPKSNWHKIFLTMKISAFLLFCCLVNVFATPTYSQLTRISLNVKDATVEDILNKIEDESEFYFLYNQKLVDVYRKVDIEADKKPIKDILDAIFDKKDVDFIVYDRQIILTPRNESEFLSIIQQSIISGTITDATTGEPMPGVNILVKGTNLGTLTDANGKYTLTVPNPNSATLVLSFIGYKVKEVPVVDQSIVDVALESDLISLDDVVVIGYGSVKKSDLTGSVLSINSKDLGYRQVSDIGSLIQGKGTGLDVAQGTIRIRGVTSLNNTDPLVVIDGFVGGNLGTVNANDIESIEVLKDASSTAIYGARGANGVILVTTKGGKAGPLKISVNAYAGIGVRPKKIGIMNASEYVDYMHDALTNAGQTISAKLLTPEVRIDVTDWQDEVFRIARNSEFNLNFSGGSEKATYFMSIGHRYGESIAIGPESSSTYIRNKNDFNISKWFRVGNNFAFNYNINKGAAPWLEHEVQMPPYYGIYDPTQVGGYSYVDTDTDRSGAYNPLPLSTCVHPEAYTLGYQTNLWAEIEPVKGLVYRIQAGVSGNFGRNKLWLDAFSGGTRLQKNGYSESSDYSFSPLIENTLTYSHVFDIHEISVMAGNTWQNYALGGGIGITSQDFDNTEVRNVFLGNSRNITNQDAWNYAYLSYFGRLNYQFNNKYLLTVNIRRDGSPRFAPQNRWGTFPSVAVAWKMHEEAFIKNLNIFNQLKLRASWGVSGNDAIGDFRYTSQVWTNGVYYPLGGVAVGGATVNENSSPDIKWESTESKTFGADMAFLKNSLTVTADYFIKTTNDILFSVPRPASMGYGLNYGGDAIVNAASVENKGFEFLVGYKGEAGRLNYSVNANYTNVKNEVTGLGLGQPFLSNVSRTDIGNPIGYFYGYVADGVFMKQSDLDAANATAQAKGFANYQEAGTSAGDIRFKDLNGDGHITGDDRTMIGNSIPKHLYGLNITLDYKGFDFIAYFQGIAGADHFYGDWAYLRGGTYSANQEDYVLDRWRSEAEPGNGIVPRAVLGDPNLNNRPSSIMVQSGNYLKLRQLSLGYTLPESLTLKAGIENLRVYASSNNVLTISNYIGYDPEVGGDNLNRGYDRLPYPNPRSIILGIQIGF